MPYDVSLLTLFLDMAMQDSDNLIVGRGNASYKISYEEFVDGLNYTCTSGIPPLQVGKGVITPNSNVKEGILCRVLPLLWML